MNDNYSTTNVASWITKNQISLLKYIGRYVAITDKVIASGMHIADVDKIAKGQNKDFVLYYVPKSINKIRILPIHIKSIAVHEWQPFYPVELLSIQNEIFKEEALIDSGADITCFHYQLGLDLGFQKYPQEMPLKACGVGGEIDFFQREGIIVIDGHKIKVPVAWIQDKEELELIIGRAVVFDCFNITFKQSIEKIKFEWLDRMDRGK